MVAVFHHLQSCQRMDIRDQFPFYRQANAPLYFDNACMTLKTQAVIEASTEYYESISSCHGRAVHHLSELTSDKVEQARTGLIKFFNAQQNTNLVFTKNTTEAINLVAQGLDWKKGDIVITLDSEHNSNFIPWLHQQQRLNITHRSIPNPPSGSGIDLDALEGILQSSQVRLLSIPVVSHITGAIFPIVALSKLCQKYGVLFMLDAAQALTTHALDFQKTPFDFLAGSMHKMFGPTGLGFLLARKELLERLQPLTLGGHTVSTVNGREFSLAPVPDRFESGLQNYAALNAVQPCLEFFHQTTQRKILEHCQALNQELTSALEQHEKISLLGPASASQRPTILNIQFPSGNIEEISRIMNKSYAVIARNGVHCSHAWYQKYNLTPSLRFSFSIYNTPQEIKSLIKAIDDVAFLL